MKNALWFESEITASALLKKAGDDNKLIWKALPYCQQRRRALDIGANIGLWTVPLSVEFERVNAFEPYGESAKCLRKNTGGNVSVHEYAVFDGRSHVFLYLNQKSHWYRFQEHKDSTLVPAVSVDEFQWDDVDLIKIDVDGGDRKVIKGAEETLKRCRPVIIIEVKEFKALADGFMAKYGYKPVEYGRVDRVYVPSSDAGSG